jgi:hypothetical protein
MQRQLVRQQFPKTRRGRFHNHANFLTPLRHSRTKKAACEAQWNRGLGRNRQGQRA